MASLQLASDDANSVIVEWNKYPPHFRMIVGSEVRYYFSEEAAMRAAKRKCKQLNLTLKKGKY